MALYVDIDDLSHDAAKRLLRQSMMHQTVAQLPIHKRAAKRKQMEEVENEADSYGETGKQADYDRDQLADLKEKTVKGKSVKMTVHDLSEPVRKSMERPPKPVKGKAPKPKKV